MKISNGQFKENLKIWAQELGLDKIAVTDCKLDSFKPHFEEKIKNKMFGDMDYLYRNQDKRLNPEQLVKNTKSIITARMNYYPPDARNPQSVLNRRQKAYISRYALGRDYHKVFRAKLKKLADKIQQNLAAHNYRVFTDSAPVMELALAQKSGLGWLGKNSCIIDKDNGSWFFLGEIYTDLALKPDPPLREHCGTCTACMKKCPTKAFIKPYLLDPRKCISYLTIEHKGPIPLELRELIGNRIYGCDDCQLYCPWNKFGKITREDDFKVRHKLDDINLIELWQWSQDDFKEKLKGSAIRRIGYEKWQRNLAVALGNSNPDKKIISALKNSNTKSPMVREHIVWALNKLTA